VKYTCRHPHTGEFVELTNREWRCIKIGIPATSSLWSLLAAEKEYTWLLKAVTEYPFDKLTLAWLVEMMDVWPSDVACSPQALLAWHAFMAEYHDIPSYAAHLQYAEDIKAKLAVLTTTKNKMLKRVAKDLQKQLKLYKKAQAIKAKVKAKRNRRNRR
jgi:hypothetical protein